MKRWRNLFLPLILLPLLCSCQKTRTPITILADEHTYLFHGTTHAIPDDYLAKAGIKLGANDRVIFLGSTIPADSMLPNAQNYTLTVRRAVALTVVSSEGNKSIQTSALTVGQALSEAGYALYAADLLIPPAETLISGPLTVTYQPSREISIIVDGSQVQSRTAAATVGQALTEAGLPLTSLDYSVPDETVAIPTDGKISVVRVVESVSLTQKTLPFTTRSELSADLEIDHNELLQGGEPGLAITRTRTRSENGQQTSQKSEGESIVRLAQDRILGIGMKIVIRTTTINGVTIEYWRALNLFATYYIPCDPQTGICHYGTSSGKPVKKGVVALVLPWFRLFRGDPLYIPGYGYAAVEDTNGANESAYWGSYWIDLGYSQTDTPDWDTRYTTVYFLTPVPSNVAETYLLP